MYVEKGGSGAEPFMLTEYVVPPLFVNSDVIVYDALC
jgi:hypothetical protein